MEENNTQQTYTAEEVIENLDDRNIIREILNVPNKNNLYKDLDLNITYLNLKNFISGRETELKKKSIEHLSKKLNVLPVTLFIDLDNIDENDIQMVQLLQSKFFSKLSSYVQKFENDQRRNKSAKTTEEDVKEVEDILNQAVSAIDLSELDIHI